MSLPSALRHSRRCRKVPLLRLMTKIWAGHPTQGIATPTSPGAQESCKATGLGPIDHFASRGAFILGRRKSGDTWMRRLGTVNHCLSATVRLALLLLLGVLSSARAGLPPGWTDTDIGTPGDAGSASDTNGQWTVSGGGVD